MLKRTQGVACAGFGIDICARHMVHERAQTIDPYAGKPVLIQQPFDLVARELAWSISAQFPTRERCVEQGARRREVPGHRTGKDRRKPAGDHDASDSTGAQGSHDGVEGLVVVVDVFEHPVAQGEVAAARFHMRREVSSVP